VKEHDIVRLKETCIDIPAGMTGTIVHVYSNNAAYEVEFIIGNTSKVVTFNPNVLEEVGGDRNFNNKKEAY